MDEPDCNTLILVSENSRKGGTKLTLAGCLKDAGYEIDQAQLVDPTRFVLRIDMGECRRDQYRAQILARNLFFEPETFSGRNNGICRAMDDENWNSKIRDLAMRRERCEFGCIGMHGSEKLRTQRINSTGHECIEKFSRWRT